MLPGDLIDEIPGHAEDPGEDLADHHNKVLRTEYGVPLFLFSPQFSNAPRGGLRVSTYRFFQRQF